MNKLSTLAILCLLTAGAWTDNTLRAQENPHAAKVYEALVRTIYFERMEPKSKPYEEAYWEPLDGGGMVPKEKCHAVLLSKTKSSAVATVGPLYLDGHHFDFKGVVADASLPLHPLLTAFEQEAPYSISYYCYNGNDPQTAFPGVNLHFGEGAWTFPLRLNPDMQVRIIGFKDDDGFRSTFLVAWKAKQTDRQLAKRGQEIPVYDVSGFVYVSCCPQVNAPAPSENEAQQKYYDRSSAPRSTAHALMRELQKSDPVRAAALAADTLLEARLYPFAQMKAELYGETTHPDLHATYEALHAKVQRAMELCRTANDTELSAIRLTLQREVSKYPFQLPNRQFDKLNEMWFKVRDERKEELWPVQESFLKIFQPLQNLTEENDSLHQDDQDFLCRNHLALSHKPVDYEHVRFTACGEHPSGERKEAYLEVSREAAGQDFHVENTLHDLTPGRYRLLAAVRAAEAEHSGVSLFCKTEDEPSSLRTVEVPAAGRTGGNIWYSATLRYENRDPSKTTSVPGNDLNRLYVNEGRGYGWNRLVIDNIRVGSSGCLTYGITTRPEITGFTALGSEWFSACEFVVQRIGD